MSHFDYLKEQIITYEEDPDAIPYYSYIRGKKGSSKNELDITDFIKFIIETNYLYDEFYRECMRGYMRVTYGSHMSDSFRNAYIYNVKKENFKEVILKHFDEFIKYLPSNTKVIIASMNNPDDHKTLQDNKNY